MPRTTGVQLEKEGLYNFGVGFLQIYPCMKTTEKQYLISEVVTPYTNQVQTVNKLVNLSVKTLFQCHGVQVAIVLHSNKYLSLILNISLAFNNFSEQYLILKAQVFEVSVIFLPCDDILGIFTFLFTLKGPVHALVFSNFCLCRLTVNILF